MIKPSKLIALLLGALLLATCGSAAELTSESSIATLASSGASETQALVSSSENGAAREVADLSALPIGDDYVSLKGPAVGSLWI
jgi:hypothetical protein